MVIDKPRCKECNSSQVYIRRITNEKVCHRCGHVEKIELEGGKN